MKKESETYVAKQILHNLRLGRDSGSLNGILVQLVLLGEGNRLLPPLVVAVDAGRDLAEEDQVVLLQALSKIHGIEVVIVVHGVAQSLVVLLLDQELVDGIVDGPLVLGLDIEQEGLDQRDVVGALEDAHNTVDVDACSEDLEQIGKEKRLLLQVEVQGAVVDLQVGDLDNDVLERVVLPRIGRALHHRQSGVVPLVVVAVQEHQLGPQIGLLRCTDHLRDVDARPEQLQVLHHTIRVVLGQSDTQLGEHTHVSPLQPETGLEDRDKLIKVTVALILADEGLQLLGVHNQVQTANLGQTELLLVNAGLVDLLPDLDAVGLAGTLHSSLVVLEVHQGGCKLGPVRDAGEEDLGSLVVSLGIGLVTRCLDVSHIGGTKEVLELGQLVKTGEAERETSVDGRLAQGLASHTQELNELLILAGVGSSLDHLVVI